MKEFLDSLEPEIRQKVEPVVLAWLSSGAVGGIWRLEQMLRSVGVSLTVNKNALA